MAASTSSSALTLSSSIGKASRQSAASSPQCVSLPSLHNRPWKNNTASCRKVARNVITMATGEAPAEVATTIETPEFVKTLQEAWDKVDDKYAVSTLVVAGAVGLWASAGLISAIDRLPLIPGVLEVVGIGYTGWFVYKNIIFKPEREALIQKVKGTYNEIIGSS